MEPSSTLDHSLKMECFLTHLIKANKPEFNKLFNCYHDKNLFSLRHFIEDEPFSKIQILVHIRILEEIHKEAIIPSLIPRYYGYFIVGEKDYYLVFEALKTSFKGHYTKWAKEHMATIGCRTKDFRRLIISLFEGLIFLKAMGVHFLDLNPENVVINISSLHE